MAATLTRKIVKIDPDKCNGCGECVPSCAEGAIEIVDGKARLAAENLCDGLGDCLGTCPQDAITIEERPAEAFDEQVVQRRKQQPQEVSAHSGGCPGAALRELSPPGKSRAKPQGGAASQLKHWPVQLALVPTGGKIWEDADVLIAADCVPLAVPDFHERLLAGKTVAVSCPKLDDIDPQIEKLTAIFANNHIRSITVAHMEVPCCGGIVYVVRKALEQAGKTDTPVCDVTVGINGTIEDQPQERKGKNQ